MTTISETHEATTEMHSFHTIRHDMMLLLEYVALSLWTIGRNKACVWFEDHMRYDGSILVFRDELPCLIVMVRSILDLCFRDEIDGWCYTLAIVNYGAHTQYEGVYMSSSLYIFFYLTWGHPTLPQPGVGIRDVPPWSGYPMPKVLAQLCHSWAIERRNRWHNLPHNSSPRTPKLGASRPMLTMSISSHQPHTLE